jgi:tetratricopeptide (TPR) repeat protein
VSGEKSGGATEAVEEFVLALRALKVSVGNPSLQELRRKSGVARSTLADALNPRRAELPRLDVVLALVRACGCGPEEAEQWRARWRRAAQDADEVRLRRPAQPDAAQAAGEAPRKGRNHLPPLPADFTARDGELDSIVAAAETAEAAASGTPVLLTVDGMAGVGKTVLAVHAGHRLAPRFADGQYFLDLHGHTPGREPLDPAAALESLLRGLGVSGKAIPDGLAERSALWRAELDGRSVLLILDNAASADQVRPLLPGGGASMVLITSRGRLPSLEGARSVSLEPLPTPDAATLFHRVLGERAEAQPAAVRTIVELCGNLPLAVRIAASRLKHRPSWPIALLAERLRDERRRLGELSVAEMAVSAAFQTSFDNLREAECRMFTFLGLHPGSDIDAEAAAALAGVDFEQAERSLEGLVDGNLLEQRRPGRYTFHDLLRLHSAQQANGFAADERAAALRRLLDHYRYQASLAMNAFAPNERDRRPRIEPPDRTAPAFPDRTAAVAWLEDERANLVAVTTLTGFDRHVADLSLILTRYLERGAHGGHALELHGRALEAARRLGDRLAEAGALRGIGLTQLQRRGFDAALEVFGQALDILESEDGKAMQAGVLNNVGAVHGLLGHLAQGKDHFEQALELSRAAGDEQNEAISLNNLALVLRRMGALQEAQARNRDALRLQQRRDDKIGQSIAYDNLGVISRHLGLLDEALEYHRQALRLDREGNDRAGETITVDNIGLVHVAMGSYGEAMACFEQSMALGVEIQDELSEALALSNIGTVHRLRGDAERARSHQERALAVLRETNEDLVLAETLNDFGETLYALADFPAARAAHEEALAITRDAGEPLETARCRELLGNALHALEEHQSAREQHTLALREYQRMHLPRAESLRARACC